MAYFSKGSGLVREVIRNPKLGSKKVSMLGKYYAFNDGFDGFDGFEVEGLPATPTEKEFLEGNTDRLSYYVPSDVASILIPLDTLFPNCTVYIVGNKEQVVSGLPDANATAVVPNTLKSSYEADLVYANYSNLTFDSWALQNESTIPYIGNSVLTAAYIKLFAENAGGNATTVGKIIVPPDFISFETGVFDYIFLKFPNCEEIEYGGLPSAYQAVDYIFPNDDEAISFGIHYSQIKTIKCGLRSPTTSKNTMLFGSSATSKWPYISISESFGVTVTSVPALSALTDMTKKELVMQTESAQEWDITTRNWSNSAWNVAIEYYYVELYGENDVLLGKFVPCYRKTDNVCGFYDMVSGNFLSNAEYFSKGNDVSSAETVERPALSTCHIYHDENTSHTLTAQIVQETLTKFPEYASCEKVIVDEWFTEYDDDAVSAIEAGFDNLAILSIMCSQGATDFDMSGFTRIDLGDGFSAAVAACRAWDIQHPTSVTGNITILPYRESSGSAENWAYSTITYIPCVKFTNAAASTEIQTFSSSSLKSIHVTFAKRITSGAPISWRGNVRELIIDFEQGTEVGIHTATAGDAWRYENMKRLILNGIDMSFNVSKWSGATRSSLIELLQSLADLSGKTGATATIGGGNLAKLTAEDIAIATNKGWTLQ